MTNYFSFPQKNSVFDAFVEESIEPESPPELTDESTSTTSLNKIPGNVDEIYPANDDKRLSEFIPPHVSQVDSSTSVSRLYNLETQQGDVKLEPLAQYRVDELQNRRMSREERDILELTNLAHRKGIQRYNVDTKITCCKHYEVIGFTANGVAGKFVSKILVVKTIQLLLILGWLLVSKVTPTLRASMRSYHNIWFYLPLSLYSLLILVIRLFPRPRLRKMSATSLAVIIGVQASLLAFSVGTLFVNLPSPLFPDFILALTIIFAFLASMAWTGMMMEFKKWIRSVTLTIFSVFLLLFFVTVFTRRKFKVIEVYLLWCPLLFMSGLLTMAVILEIQSILTGHRFDVTPPDWLFAATYL